MSKQSLTVKDSQELVKRLVKELGFEKETTAEKFLLLLEEIGEFAKASRKVSGIKTHKNSKTHDLEEEAADIFWYLLDLCNLLNIDLEQALLKKTDKNQKRKWQ